MATWAVGGCEVERRGGGGRDEREHRGGWELWGAEVERLLRRPIWRSAGSTIAGGYARPPAREKAAEENLARRRRGAGVAHFLFCILRYILK